MNIAVWCAANPGNDPAFVEGARTVGTWLGENGHTLVYGGGKAGLMGAVAESCTATNGSVIGINVQIDDFLAQLYEKSTHSYIAPTLYLRKANMTSLADAYLCLPGGLGTLDELSEVLALLQSGVESKRIAIYNIHHFYDSLLAQFSRFVSEGLAKEIDSEKVLVSDSFDQITEFLTGGEQQAQKRRRAPESESCNPNCIPGKIAATLQQARLELGPELEQNLGSDSTGRHNHGAIGNPGAASNPETPNTRGAIMLMVSGGSDSTALAYAAAELRAENGPLSQYAIAVMHLNHKLRGKDADDDARFVEQLAENLGFPFFEYQADIAKISNDEHGNIEAIGRRERYEAAEEALADFCIETGVPFDNSYIFTAHTQNDRIENFYMRSIVGTGPGGFRSMDYRRGHIVHPMLDCSRDELRAYVKECAHRADCCADRYADHSGSEGTGQTATPVPVVCSSNGLPWRNDPTNAGTDRFRTYIRNEVMPRITSLNPRMMNTLCRSMNLIADEDDYLEEQAAELAHGTVEWINPRAADVLTESWGGILPNMHVDVVTEGCEPEPDYSAGCVLSPRFGDAHVVLQRRVVFRMLQLILGPNSRVETASVDAVIGALGRSGHVNNIQGNLAVSTNKRGTRIEPMDVFRARRRRL